MPYGKCRSRAAAFPGPGIQGRCSKRKENKMTHREFYNNSVDKARGKNHEDCTLLMLGSIASSLAAIADSLEGIEGSLESISDNMWTKGSDL